MFDWETHQKNMKFRDTRLLLMAGRIPLGRMLFTADYKGSKGTQNLSYGVYPYLHCGFL